MHATIAVNDKTRVVEVTGLTGLLAAAQRFLTDHEAREVIITVYDFRIPREYLYRGPLQGLIRVLPERKHEEKHLKTCSAFCGKMHCAAPKCEKDNAHGEKFCLKHLGGDKRRRAPK